MEDLVVGVKKLVVGISCWWENIGNIEDLEVIDFLGKDGFIWLNDGRYGVWIEEFVKFY